MNEYIIGEPFPDGKYIKDYDSVVSRITADGFDIILTLTNISDEELGIISENPIEVSVFFYNEIAHVILYFDDTLKFDFAINIKKIKPEVLPYWLNNDSSVTTLFVLEEVTGNILNLRMFNFPKMKTFKELLFTYQSKHSRDEIDARIADAQMKFPTSVMHQHSIHIGRVDPPTVL